MDKASTGCVAEGKASVEDSKASERELQTHFTGRRAAVRTYKFLDCEIQGNNSSFAGMVVDVSRTGALVRVLDASFAEPAEQEQLMLYTARVWYHFEEGLQLSFLRQSVQATADVVRVTGYCGRGSGLNLIGVHFRTELSVEECDRLGIECGEDRPSMGPLAEEHNRNLGPAVGA
ncbi:MAG: PilZ domain-containing protein [Planctomycetota bacterium]|jgi:hypothetical protein